MDIPFRKRLSTRFGILIVLIVLVLASATAILIARGFNQIDEGTATQVQQLEALGLSPAADLSDIARNLVINLIAVFLLTLVAASVFSRSLLTEPITELVKGTQAVASGQLGVTLPVTSEDELGLLASSFNTMSTNLAARTEELLKLNEALRESEMRLEQRVEERTAELVALLDISNMTALTLEDLPLLDRIFDHLHEIVPYKAVAIFKRFGEDVLDEVIARASLSEQLDTEMQDVVMTKARRTVTRDELTHDLFPLLVRDKAVGVLALEHTGAPLSEERVTLISAFANQAGVTLENITLYERVQEQAALGERQHLARELHDSVSQALYSILLGTHAVRKQLDSDPEKASKALEYVQNLAEAGLAEMRALIFELRPEVLEEEGLAAALRKQVEALEVRHHVIAEFEADDTLKPFTLPFATKQALYRIAQEALHNVVKHARAQRVRVHLRRADEHVELSICDSGQGFDPAQDFPGHLGLKSMRERSLSLGGSFDLHSDPNSGTTVTVRVPARV